jgi:uncharacterized protein (DUF362 family)
MTALSKVVIVRGKGVLARKNSADPKILSRMYERGVRLLAGQSDIAAGLRAIFSPSDRVGIKINAIAAPELTTPPEVSLPFARLLTGIGIPESNVIIWDRTNRELKDAGYRLNLDGGGFKIFGTDTAGAGYPGEPVSHLNIGSLFSAIQMSRITASVSFAVLKDHGMAGITAGLKNYYGAIHNPNKYHDDNCDPFVAELFDTPPIKAKHRLTILDALVVQYHRGPSYHARWAETMETLVFSLDPVAADFIGWQIVERLRKDKGLPSLEEDRRLPSYIRTAERMGLGKAAPADIQVVEEEV